MPDPLPHPADPQPRDGHTPPDPAELADLYAAGALSHEEAAAFERRISAGDPSYLAEHRRIRPALELLLAGAGEVEPPARLRQQMAHDLGADAAPAAAFSGREPGEHPGPVGGGPATGILVARASQTRWRPTGVRGVRYQRLHASRRENRRTLVLRMDAGAQLPDHGHTGTEEIIMISGDLSIAGVTLGPGDYMSITPGAQHGVPRTSAGCTCIVVSGYQPFPVGSWVRMAGAAVAGWFRRR